MDLEARKSVTSIYVHDIKQITKEKLYDEG